MKPISELKAVLLAGGTGGAKLARGLADHLGENLTVVANTGDDIEIYGTYVSPDPDLISYWLADIINERGWGIKGDTFKMMEEFKQRGEEIWFNLGDRDLKICLEREFKLLAGATLTETLNELRSELGFLPHVLPATDDPLRTWVKTAGSWKPFQKFMIKHAAQGPIEGVEFRGAESATASTNVLSALASADLIVIGPSNPVISIGPILAVQQLSESLKRRTCPMVAVSPIVSGEVLKGPTAAFMQHANVPINAEGILKLYEGLIDGLVTDEQLPEQTLPTLKTDTNLSTPQQRHRLAGELLTFGQQLSR